ncbi:fatty acid desaturase [Thalassomonas sp. M1454]|uniref:fatty acid desaturase n=1 Tax=Thalassomonas sp. M1454 TaxID=2594477 RepID=UPI00117D1AD1|nr:fatty acid desaturase [Thalassomonas sp. M1454]TRX58112.1 2Fe-2S iron-sulfur cluster binding domain-containing protein [Thalassomonas sp. M1454]
MTTATKGHINEAAIADLTLLSQRPEFKKLLYVPQINWVIALSCISALIAWAGLSYFWLQGDISAVWVTILSTYTFFIFILTVHEASHLIMSRNSTFNDWFTNILTFIPYPHMPIAVFRHQHLTHHRDTCGEEDPDEYLYHGNALVRTFKVFTQDLYWNYWSFKNRKGTSNNTHLVNVIGFTSYMVILAVGFSSSYWYEFTMLYFIPQRIGVAVAIYMFAYVQHPSDKCEVKESSPFKTTSVIRGFDSAFAKVYFGQNRHLIHHLYPSMPIYRNWQAWQLGKDVFERQELVNIGIDAESYTEKNATKITEYLTQQDKLAVTITAIATVANGIKSYTLSPINADAKLPKFTPGAHIDVEIKPGLIRQYSLCNAPSNSDEYVIAVQKEENGRGGSKQLHQQFSIGDTVIISKPRNLFALKPANKVVLFAGGIGITPMLSMAWQLHQSNTEFEFHYCVATQSKWAFRDQWQQLPFAESIKVYIDDEDSANIDAEQVLLANKQADVYVCGPAGFMNYIERSVESASLNSKQFNKESFAGATVDKHAKPFQLSIKGRDQVFDIPADKSIVQVLKEHEIFIPVSCENGVCGTCKCKVTQGEVDHKDIVLNDNEHQKQRLFTPCITRAKSEYLEISL